jgi:hypothetical protein
LNHQGLDVQRQISTPTRLESSKLYLTFTSTSVLVFVFLHYTAALTMLNHAVTNSGRVLYWPRTTRVVRKVKNVAVQKVKNVCAYNPRSCAYCATLRRLRKAIQNRRRGKPSRGIVLIHDNACPHTARQTQTLLHDEFHWDTFDHPPYSPDLAPSDFYYFPNDPRLYI